MKKITAFIGSAHRKNTYQAVVQFINNLQVLGEIEYEIVTLSDYRLGICRGCRVCFEKGEAFCPLKDDRDVLFDKISASDGVIFATPNYTWDMSGMMKVFLDRFGYACHRPRYFGKAFTSIVVQAVGRGEKIVETFDFTAGVLGFNTLKGMTITAWDPRTEQQQQKIDRAIAAQSRRFYALLAKPAYAMPTLLQLMIFRFGRTSIKQLSDPNSLDYQYFAGKGWLESDYYYPTRLNALMRTAGKFFDAMSPMIRTMLS